MHPRAGLCGPSRAAHDGSRGANAGATRPVPCPPPGAARARPPYVASARKDGATAEERFSIPSLAWTGSRCVFTVRGPRPRISAMSRFDLPRVRRIGTSASPRRHRELCAHPCLVAPRAGRRLDTIATTAPVPWSEPVQMTTASFARCHRSGPAPAPLGRSVTNLTPPVAGDAPEGYAPTGKRTAPAGTGDRRDGAHESRRAPMGCRGGDRRCPATPSRFRCFPPSGPQAAAA